MLYAEVCVNTPLGARPQSSGSEDDPLARTFTYAVPDRLADRLQPGHLVWAPFRGRRLQGMVMALSDRPPDFQVREIIALVWAQPLLSPVQLELARWIGETVLAPLIEALRLMMPAGLAQRGRTILVRTRVPAPAGLPERQRALLARIAEAAGDWAEVSRGLKGVTQRADLEPLIALGLVAREVAFPSPPPRPKTDRKARLIADPVAIARVLPTVGRQSKQADALIWLAARADAAPVPLDALCAAVGCTPGPVKALAQRGWVTIALRRSAQEPATVALALPPAAVDDAVASLRGNAKHRAVVEALAGQGGTAWVGRLYAQTGAASGVLRDLEAAGLLAVDEEMVWRDPLAGHEFALDRPPELTDDQQRVWDAIARRLGADAGPSAPPLAPGSEHAAATASRPDVGSGAQVSPRFLLHGVTGSGKTEIYLRAIAEVLRQGRQAVVLVPEIALTPQTIRRFAARFPGQVTVWHSELGAGERFDVWRRVRAGDPAAQVVVGSRSALFLPFPGLGVIVLDEEHEPSYKQERTPRYHARAVALELGRLCGAAVILGSATPALETTYAAVRGELLLLALPRRIIGHGERPEAAHEGPPARSCPQGDSGSELDAGRSNASTSLGAGLEAGVAPDSVGAASPAGAAGRPPLRRETEGSAVRPARAVDSGELPPVRVVDMRQELRAGNRSIFSRPLQAGLRRVLDAGHQAILYLNRRGAASFVLCRDCGRVETCPRCAVPLTYHGAGDALLCHHCNRRYPVPTTCSGCGGRRIRFFGAGTERVEEAVKLEFPEARTLRWDRDVTGPKGSHDAILARFVAHEADVLIGTQMIAKGLDLPLVTLVGVIAADTALYLPDFRAAERTFQLLTQVAGRAGRSALGGEVVVQTYHPDHYAIVAASNHDYERFYREEMLFRREQGYPPVGRLVRLIYLHSRRDRAQAEAERVAEEIRALIATASAGEGDEVNPDGGARRAPDTTLIGPAPCYFARERNEYRWQIVLRGPDPAALLRRTVLPLGWRVDVDPMDLL